MRENYLTFRKYSDPQYAEELEILLKGEEVDAFVENTSASFEPSFSRTELNNEYRVKIKSEDFAKADTILKRIAYHELEEVDRGHYLFQFTDDELRDVVTKADEWNEYDYLLAQKILAERGKEIKPEELQKIKTQRLTELAKPDKSSKRLIWWGYRAAILGGFPAIIIGWQLSFQKKTLPNGAVVYSFAKADREHGNRILTLGVFFLAFWIVMRILFPPHGEGDYYEHILRFW